MTTAEKGCVWSGSRAPGSIRRCAITTVGLLASSVRAMPGGAWTNAAAASASSPAATLCILVLRAAAVIVHQPKRDSEEQKSNGAAPVADRRQQEGLMAERRRGPDRERERGERDQQPADGTHTRSLQSKVESQKAIVRV